MLRAVAMLVVVAGCRAAPASTAPAESPPPAEPTSSAASPPPADAHAAGVGAPAYAIDEPPDDDDAIGAVQLGNTSVTGALDKEAIRAVVRSRIADVRGCYNETLVNDPTAQGRLVVQFTIDPEGQVSAAAVTQNELPTDAVGRCVVEAVKRWAFPKPQGGAIVDVTYPFVLVPG